MSLQQEVLMKENYMKIITESETRMEGEINVSIKKTSLEILHLT